MQQQAQIEALIARVALRDRSAFAALYDATSTKLFGICLHVLRDRSDAEDALQEVFIRIWENADRYAATGHSPMTWLITVARNRAIDRLRARPPATSGTQAFASLRDSKPGPEATAVARSESERVAACFEELEPSRAAAVRAAYLDGATYIELADRHAVPLNTMRTWLRRSLLKLRECLGR